MWDEAAALVVGERPGDLNQAIMELGATLCTPRNPSRRSARFGRRATPAVGDAEALPIKRKKTKQTKMRAVAAWLEGTVGSSSSAGPRKA